MATAKKKAPAKATAKKGESEKAKKAQSTRMTKQARSYQPKGQSYVDRAKERLNTGDLSGWRGPVKDYTLSGDSTGNQFQIPNYMEGRVYRRRSDASKRGYAKQVSKQANAAKVAKGKK
jgi:hypothetical protein